MIRSEQQNKMKFTLFTAFLFSIGWMSVVVAGDGRPVPCCLIVSGINIRAENIVHYTIQDQPRCPIRAVRFHTKKNKVICSDPDKNWAKNAMRIVDGRKKTKPSQKPTMCYSRTNVNLTVNTANKTPGTETETSTTTPVTSIVTTIKTSGFSDGRPVDCCNTVTNTRIPVEKILYYDMQKTNLCPERAVRFYTKKNITICSDPDSIWAKKAKAIVDGRTKIKTFGPETEINKTSIQPTSVSKDNPESSLSTATTFTSSATKDCCLAVTKNKPTFHEIVDYKVQETPLCSVRAVLFITVGNNKICSSPAEDWVRDYIQNLNRRKKTIDKREFAIISIKDPYKNTNNYFCLKKEPSKYFCVKQP